MSKIEVNQIGPQCGTTLTVGCGAGQTVNIDANTVTLGRCGATVSLAAGATQSGFGRTGTVDWDTTAKTATFSAVSGDGFFCNTTSSAFTCNLPAGAAGAIVSLADYAGTWQTNNLTVSPNGSDKIGGVNANVVLNTEGQSVTFVYVDGTQGWVNVQDSTSNERGVGFIIATGGTITTCGNDKIHTFTGPGTFSVSNTASCSSNNVVSYLVLAGGGGGGGGEPGYWSGGGGGAGGFREDKSPATPYTASPLDGAGEITVTQTSFPITVGGGGAAGTATSPGNCSTAGTNGSNSVFSTITSTGGGGGGISNGSTSGTVPARNGKPGGSGGASGGGGAAPIGNGNTPPVSPPQGQNGGQGSSPNAGVGGGGGGAGGTGGSFPSNTGGAGVASSITGSSVTRAAGGQGGSGSSGSNNTGDGGGSNACSGTTGAGGSGIVIIRYKYQ